MTTIHVDIDTCTRYRVFAGQGNGLSEDGVSVVVQIVEANLELRLDFWTRVDAVTFFRCLTDAATACPIQEAGDAGTMVAEGITLSWEDVEAMS